MIDFNLWLVFFYPLLAIVSAISVEKQVNRQIIFFVYIAKEDPVLHNVMKILYDFFAIRSSKTLIVFYVIVF
jgi:hypothetical protein